MNVEKIGLIGLGKHGVRYAKHIREDFPGLRLHAVSRRDQQRLAEWHDSGARTFSDYRDLIAQGDCDALVAVVPPHLHLDIVRRAAAAGLPLLLEKPAAPDLDSARAMAEAVARSSVPVMVAQTLRYNAVVRTLRAQREAIGPITSASLSQRFEPSSLDWLDDPAQAGAGIALHTGVHSFDLLRHLTGREIVAVSALAASLRTQRTEDSCAVALELAGGALATVSLSRVTKGRSGHIELSGEQGTLAGDHVLNLGYLIRGREAQPLEVGPAVPTVREIVGDFVAALRGSTAMPVPLSEGLAAVAVASACLQSAATGLRVEVPRLA